jgi:flagellar hook assembly protein FlgD
MTMNNKVVIAVVVTAALVAGCTQVEPPGDRAVGFETGNVVTEADKGYRFSSHLSADAHRTEDRAYEDVEIVFYDSNGEVIRTVRAGRISTSSDGQNISVTLERKPAYVVARTDGFWRDENLRVYGLRWSGSNDTYVSYRVTEEKLMPSQTTTA